MTQLLAGYKSWWRTRTWIIGIKQSRDQNSQGEKKNRTESCALVLFLSSHIHIWNETMNSFLILILTYQSVPSSPLSLPLNLDLWHWLLRLKHNLWIRYLFISCIKRKIHWDHLLEKSEVLWNAYAFNLYKDTAKVSLNFLHLYGIYFQLGLNFPGESKERPNSNTAVESIP